MNNKLQELRKAYHAELINQAETRLSMDLQVRSLARRLDDLKSQEKESAERLQRGVSEALRKLVEAEMESLAGAPKAQGELKVCQWGSGCARHITGSILCSVCPAREVEPITPERDRPAYNHTRGESALHPCRACFLLQTDTEKWAAYLNAVTSGGRPVVTFP